MLDLESLFKLSYGMCILTSKEDGKLNGCIVNTVFQLTPDPPVVAVSVNKQVVAGFLPFQYFPRRRRYPSSANSASGQAGT